MHNSYCAMLNELLFLLSAYFITEVNALISSRQFVAILQNCVLYNRFRIAMHLW